MIVDIIILSFMLLGIYMGYSKGLFRQVFSLFSLIIGYIISLVLSSRIAFLLSNFLPFSTNNVVSELNNKVSSLNLNISEGYYKIISFFIIFFGIKLIFFILGNLIGTITKLPVIKSVNRFLGAVLGFIEVYILIFVVIYFMYVIPVGENITKLLLESKISTFIFENTPILSDILLEKFFSYIK